MPPGNRSRPDSSGITAENTAAAQATESTRRFETTMSQRSPAIARGATPIIRRDGRHRDQPGDIRRNLNAIACRGASSYPSAALVAIGAGSVLPVDLELNHLADPRSAGRMRPRTAIPVTPCRGR